MVMLPGTVDGRACASARVRYQLNNSSKAAEPTGLLK